MISESIYYLHAQVVQTGGESCREVFGRDIRKPVVGR